MPIPQLIGHGVGFTPGSVRFIPTLGLGAASTTYGHTLTVTSFSSSGDVAVITSSGDTALISSDGSGETFDGGTG